MDMKDVPIMPVSTGYRPQTWMFSTYGKFLSIYGTYNHISLVFNLSSADDIRQKLQTLYRMRDMGNCSADDVNEVEERVRMLSNLQIGGNGEHSSAALTEGTKRKKGQKYYTYSDGIKKEHTARGPSKVVSSEQKKAAENARKYAHTPEAEKKRRKSISARGDEKALGI